MMMEGRVEWPPYPEGEELFNFFAVVRRAGAKNLSAERTRRRSEAEKSNANPPAGPTLYVWRGTPFPIRQTLGRHPPKV